MFIEIHWVKSVTTTIKVSAVSMTTAAVLPVLRDWRHKRSHLFEYLCNEVQGRALQKKNCVSFIEFLTDVSSRQHSRAQQSLSLVNKLTKF